VNPGFCEKIEVSRVPPWRPSRTTGWEPCPRVYWD